MYELVQPQFAGKQLQEMNSPVLFSPLTPELEDTQIT